MKYGILIEKNPEFAFELAVKGMPVSYTHLDVYKRQRLYKNREKGV